MSPVYEETCRTLAISMYETGRENDAHKPVFCEVFFPAAAHEFHEGEGVIPRAYLSRRSPE